MTESHQNMSTLLLVVVLDNRLSAIHRTEKISIEITSLNTSTARGDFPWDRPLTYLLTKMLQVRGRHSFKLILFDAHRADMDEEVSISLSLLKSHVLSTITVSTRVFQLYLQ